MPFSYHPPTRTHCPVCEELHAHDLIDPIIDSHNGKASSADNFPFHNWYNFVLGYSPKFPEYMLQREKITKEDLVIDPFMGSGTTLVVAKTKGTPSAGIDANDFMVDAARAKLNWDIDVDALREARTKLLGRVRELYGAYGWFNRDNGHQLALFDPRPKNKYQLDFKAYTEGRRPTMLDPRYMTDQIFAQALMIDDSVQANVPEGALQDLFSLALTSILVPISNVRYGPGFGLIPPRPDVDVLAIYEAKLDRMIYDLENATKEQRKTRSRVVLGDSRQLSKYFDQNSASLMITSPPYPGDHEYTKHTRLELIFRGYAENHEEFRVIKKRMLRGSTTNLYKEDNDREPISGMETLKKLTDLIEERLTSDGATSGFEGLYTKVVWEYFGGMYKALEECYQVLKPGGKIALLVSDSHAFKMVHIQTARLLQAIGEQLGFVQPEIILWQYKVSTSHKYSLRENILVLQKPK